LALACTPPEERAGQARESVNEAIARGDRQAALEAIGELRGDTADSQLELAQLLGRAGYAPEAGWLPEIAARLRIESGPPGDSGEWLHES
jgi:hypothetical protein